MKLSKEDSTKTAYAAVSAELLLHNTLPKIWETAFINGIDVSQIRTEMVTMKNIIILTHHGLVIYFIIVLY